MIMPETGRVSRFGGTPQLTTFGLDTRARWLSVFAAALLASLLVLMMSPGAHAVTEDVYTVRDVPVDATADEAAEARVIAIRRGRALALRLLLQRLTREVDWAILPVLPTSEVTVLGAGFEISNERNSPTRYLATITYRFKPNDVRELLQKNSLVFSEVQARKLVVLPVFIDGDEIDGDEARIFQDDRDWSFAWANRNYGHELVPLITPLGDLGDVIAAPVEAALDNDFAALSEFAERYGVQDILIAKMQLDDMASPVVFDLVRLSPTETETWTLVMPAINAPEEEPAEDDFGMSEFPLDEEPVLEEPSEVEPLLPVEGLKFDEPTDERALTEEPIKTEEEIQREKIAAMMEVVIDRGVARLQEDWKARTIIEFDTQDILVASARYQGLKEWLKIKEAIRLTPNIARHEYVAVSTVGAHMEWEVIGTPNQLALALAQHDVYIEPGTVDDIAETEEISEGNFVAQDTGFEDRDSVSIEDPNSPWSDNSNPWTLEEEEEANTQDRVDEPGTGEESLLEEDLGKVRRILPRTGTEKGRFYIENAEDEAAFQFSGRMPEFWIVRYEPKAEPEVWPTEEGAPGNEDGVDGPVEEMFPQDPDFDPIFDNLPTNKKSETDSPHEGPF